MSSRYEPRSSKDLPPYPDIQPIPVAVDHIGGYRLRVEFSDGTAGTLDMTREITRLQGRVIQELRRPEQFQAVKVDGEGGTIAWPPGDTDDRMSSYDFSPDYLYRRCVFGDGQPLADDPFAEELFDFTSSEGTDATMVEPNATVLVVRLVLGIVLRRWKRATRTLASLAGRGGRWLVGVLDRVTGVSRGQPLSFEAISSAQTFVDLVGSTDSHEVHSAAEKKRYKEWTEALGAAYMGWILRADYSWRDVDEYCTLTFLDGSSVTCHVGSNGKALAPVRLEPPCAFKANDLRRFIDHNEYKRTFVETLASRPGLHIDAGTGVATVLPGEDRLVTEDGELKAVKSTVWDWKKAWKKGLAKQKGTYGRE